MLLSQITYFALVASAVIIVCGLVYRFFHLKRELDLKITVAIGLFLSLIVVVLFMSKKTSVIIITSEKVKSYQMLGESEYTLQNGDVLELKGLNHGNLIVNNTNDSCVIERITYSEKDAELSGKEQYLTGVLLLVKPQSKYVFHGAEIKYLFTKSPDKLKRHGDSNAEWVEFELRYLEQKDWKDYWLYDGTVRWGKPDGEGTLWSAGGVSYSGVFSEGFADLDSDEK